MFGRRKAQTPAFERGSRIPVIRASICTGEQTAGFKDPDTGRFHEVMLIRTRADLNEFLRTYQVREDELQREW